MWAGKTLARARFCGGTAAAVWASTLGRHNSGSHDGVLWKGAPVRYVGCVGHGGSAESNIGHGILNGCQRNPSGLMRVRTLGAKWGDLWKVEKPLVYQNCRGALLEKECRHAFGTFLSTAGDGTFPEGQVVKVGNVRLESGIVKCWARCKRCRTSDGKQCQVGFLWRD